MIYHLLQIRPMSGVWETSVQRQRDDLEREEPTGPLVVSPSACAIGALWFPETADPREAFELLKAAMLTQRDDRLARLQKDRAELAALQFPEPP